MFVFSQAVLVDKTLYISGQLGLDYQTGSLVPGGVEAEAKKALDNMGHIFFNQHLIQKKFQRE